MKQFDLKSVLVGAVLALGLIVAVAAARGSRAAWEYKVVFGTFGNPDVIGSSINSSAAEGWEFVSASGPNNGNYVIAVMRREKK